MTDNIKNKQRIEPHDMERYIKTKWINKDKKVYGSKRINLLRIKQEKKIKALLLVMRSWGGSTTEYDRLLWRESFNSILKMETHLRSGLNHTLSKKEMNLANMLYKKYC
jgi:hypothetical protein